MDAALLRRVEQQRVALLYGNTLAVSGSALLMAALIAVIAWPYTSIRHIVRLVRRRAAGAGGVQWLALRYRRASDAKTDRARWGMRMAVAAGVAGLVWGSAVFVLVGATIAPLGSDLRVPRRPRHYQHHDARVLPAGAERIRGADLRHAGAALLARGGYNNAALGVMWIAVLGYVLLFVDRQARAVARRSACAARTSSSSIS